jgi:PAS domain S-box-containing protein
MLGRSGEEILRASLQHYVHPEDLPSAVDAYTQVMESGNPAVLCHRFLRSDGTCIWLNQTVCTGREAASQSPYLMIVAVDVTAEASRAPAQTVEFRMLLDSAADGFYCVDRQGLTTLCNKAFRRLLGFKREEDVIGKNLHPLIHHSRPDGSPYPEADCPIHKTLQSGREAHVSNEVFYRLDGTSFPVEYRVRPIERNGEIQGAVCTFTDLTERKQSEARQEVLNHELAHRMKNTLAMVQAIVGQTLRNAPTSRDAIQAINQRLVALGNAHAALTQTRWGNASIMEVIDGALAAHQSQAGRIHTSGPRVELGSRTVLMITLALHELCTNAAKYGALSRDTGSVKLEWSIKGGAADARFHLTWKERGGPSVTPPTRTGFGSRLIAETIGSDLGGEASLTFEPDGVRWNLEAPLTAIKT